MARRPAGMAAAGAEADMAMAVDALAAARRSFKHEQAGPGSRKIQGIGFTWALPKPPIRSSGLRGRTFSKRHERSFFSSKLHFLAISGDFP